VVQLVGGGHALWVIVQRLLPLTRWTVAVPVLGAIIFAVTWGHQPPTAVLVMVGLLLAGCVFAAVHHAEVVAHRVGEPFGALILAVAVTVIEVGLIVMLMVSGGPDTSTLARDTVFAAAMITCNGIVGLALLVGSLQPGVASFKPEGTAPALATVATLATLTLVLPTFTTSTPGPEYSAEQLGFASSHRWRCICCSFSSRPCVTAGTSCPPRPTFLMVRSRRGRPRVARRWQAWACWSWDWSRWWGWPRSNHRRSRAPSPR